jgi:hypothetical protein
VIAWHLDRQGVEQLCNVIIVTNTIIARRRATAERRFKAQNVH